MHVPFMDLSAVNDAVYEDFLEDVKAIFESGQFVSGPHIQRFEELFAKFIGNKFCVTVGSGSDAILLALRALGISAGDEVICPAFGSVSAAEAVVRLGATPVFVDCRPETYTLDPDKTLASITSRTRAIVPVHIFGHAAEIDRVVTIARTYSVPVIEDVRHAVGGRIGHRRLGTYGDLGAYCFHPSSPLGSAGEGGAVTSNNEEYAGLVRKLRNHGVGANGTNEVIGYSSKLDAIQAALLTQKLQDLDENNAECIENAGLYNRLFLASPVVAPSYNDEGASIYSSYAVLVPERDKLVEHLKEKGIGYSVPTVVATHQQPCFGFLNYKEGAFPIAEDIAKRAICLPIASGLKKRQIEEVAETVLAFYGVKI